MSKSERKKVDKERAKWDEDWVVKLKLDKEVITVKTDLTDKERAE